MNYKLLSIIIPTYNMERYLPRCLNSLVNAVDVLPMLEVLVINDGSKDDSSRIAHQYQERYPDSVFVIDKENGNYGSCVNRGLREATGKYFRVLDADDWVDTQGLELLVDKLKDATSDAIVTHFSKEFTHKQKSVLVRTDFKRFDETLRFDAESLEGVDIPTDFVMHKLTYRTELLKNINFHQTEGISYTDTEYVYYPLMAVEKIVFYDICLYRYFIGREGQSISIPSRIKHADDMLVILQRMMSTPLSEELDNGFKKDVRLCLQRVFFSSYYWSILVIQRLTPENNKKLLQLDKRLKTWDFELYQELDTVKCLGIEYIKHWRKTGRAIIPSGPYRVLRKLLKS